jgi:hypothetical protein
LSICTVEERAVSRGTISEPSAATVGVAAQPEKAAPAPALAASNARGRR